jgi:hypothetical protein
MRKLGGILILVLSLAAPAHATDGVIEINAARAAAGGVTAGDAPGFPVEIFTRGNFRLTSDLVVPAGASAGIAVYAAGTQIDLNGFTISCTTTCTGINLSCAPSGTGVGIDASAADSVVVRNGRVTGFGVYGVFLNTGSRAKELSVDNNALGGITTDAAAVVSDNIVRMNGGYGISAGPDSRVVENTVTGNGGPGIVTNPSAIYDRNVVNHNVGAGPSFAHLRRFYLTKNQLQGVIVTNPCDVGFHFASLWEISDPSKLTYDAGRGNLGAPPNDLGSGPPTLIAGWVRTGYPAFSSTGPPGNGTCFNWTTSLGTPNVGTTASLNANWDFSQEPAAAGGTWPWLLGTMTCNQTMPVWCVED